jgi:hypothetical protein
MRFYFIKTATAHERRNWILVFHIRNLYIYFYFLRNRSDISFSVLFSRFLTFFFPTQPEGVDHDKLAFATKELL